MKGKPAKRTKEGQQNLGSLDLKHEVSKTELKKILQLLTRTPPLLKWLSWKMEFRILPKLSPEHLKTRSEK